MRLSESPRATATSSSSSDESMSGKIVCVSGSPNRQLNSTTFGPSSVITSPAYNSPLNGDPASRIADSVGLIISVIAREMSSGVAMEVGAYAPIPPVFGPKSPSSRRLWSCAASKGRA